MSVRSKFNALQQRLRCWVGPCRGQVRQDTGGRKPGFTTPSFAGPTAFDILLLVLGDKKPTQRSFRLSHHSTSSLPLSLPAADLSLDLGLS